MSWDFDGQREIERKLAEDGARPSWRSGIVARRRAAA